MMSTENIFRCPYCIPVIKGSGRKVPRKEGLYKVRQMGDIVLIFECMKCHGIFKMKAIGSPLRWDDLSSVEKRMFNKLEGKKWVRNSKEQVKAD